MSLHNSRIDYCKGLQGCKGQRVANLAVLKKEREGQMEIRKARIRRLRRRSRRLCRRRGWRASTHRLRCPGSRGTVASPSVHIHCSPQLGPFPFRNLRTICSCGYCTYLCKVSTKARHSNPKEKADSSKEQFNKRKSFGREVVSQSS